MYEASVEIERTATLADRHWSIGCCNWWENLPLCLTTCVLPCWTIGRISQSLRGRVAVRDAAIVAIPSILILALRIYLHMIEVPVNLRKHHTRVVDWNHKTWA